MTLRFPLVAAVALFLCAPSAKAWEGTQQLVHGSAHVVEKGETMIGVLTPLAYGVHDRATLFTHPALHLLLTPNIWARGAILKGNTAVAVEGGYQQTFFSISQADSSDEGDYPGYLQAGAIFSHTFAGWIQMNLAAGYVADFSTGDGDQPVWAHGLYMRAGVTFLFLRKNFIFSQVRLKANGGTDFDTPTTWVLFGRHLGRMRLGFGACVGRFVLGDGNDSVSFMPDEVPVYPWADVWWRF